MQASKITFNANATHFDKAIHTTRIRACVYIAICLATGMFHYTSLKFAHCALLFSEEYLIKLDFRQWLHTGDGL